ncbi:restriction endonuclease [Microcoleus sp.]|uniref:restriction endonuclease n=1 Tax=Microcoleus sp. TaxID=44472 RepID=UPI0035238552
MQDVRLEKNIEYLKSVIRSWAQQKELWHDYDCTFKSWNEHFDDEPPENPCVLVLCASGQLGEILYDYGNELYDEFDELTQNTGFYVKNYGGGVFTFEVIDEELEEAYRNYFEWRWICDLVQPDFSDLYEEVYERFHKSPDDLYHLDPRKFEVLLDGIFRNNGYHTKLGSGRSDGGVDIRLYSNDVIGEVVTLVQAKRYATSNPIDLQAVQALSAVVEDERANQGLFVTTSRYLPCAQRFADRQKTRIKLATSDEVSRWSFYAAERIIRDKSSLVKPDHLKYLLNLNGLTDTLEGKIFRATEYYGMIRNCFAIVLRDSKGAALLMELPRTTVSIVGDSFRGYEIPDTGIAALSYLNAEKLFRAKKKYKDDGEVYLWGNLNRYSLWDGIPQYYDWCD